MLRFLCPYSLPPFSMEGELKGKNYLVVWHNIGSTFCKDNFGTNTYLLWNISWNSVTIKIFFPPAPALTPFLCTNGCVTPITERHPVLKCLLPSLLENFWKHPNTDFFFFIIIIFSFYFFILWIVILNVDA